MLLNNRYDFNYYFLFGLFIIYLGKKRIRFEAKHDPNYDLIPDEDVKKFWRWMSRFNIQRSRFYVYFFGPFLMFFAFINVLMIYDFNARMPVDWFPKELIIYFFISIIVGLYMSETQSLSWQPRYGYGSRVGRNKLAIVKTYQFIEFHSIRDLDWLERKFKHPIGDMTNSFYQRTTSVFPRMRYIPYWWVIGNFIYFTTLIMLCIYCTLSIYLYNFY